MYIAPFIFSCNFSTNWKQTRHKLSLGRGYSDLDLYKVDPPCGEASSGLKVVNYSFV
jgi:hypothetical protein